MHMDSRKEVFDQIVAYIDRHYRDINLKQLLDTFHYNRNFFFELFREQIDTTYVQYLQNVRLDKARELLADSSKSVREICDEVGYRNITWFYQIFYRRYGLTPKQVRERGDSCK